MRWRKIFGYQLTTFIGHSGSLPVDELCKRNLLGLWLQFMVQLTAPVSRKHKNTPETACDLLLILNYGLLGSVLRLP